MRVALKYALIFTAAAALMAGTSIGVALVYRNEILKNLLASFAQSQHMNFEAKEVNFVLSSNLKNTKFIFNNVLITSKNDSAFSKNFSMQTQHVGVEVDLLSFLSRKKLKIEKIEVIGGNLQTLPSTHKGGQGKSDELENLLRHLKMLSAENFTIYAAQSSGKTSKVALQKIVLQTIAKNVGVDVKVKGNLQLNAEKSNSPTANITLDGSGILTQGVFMLNESRATLDNLRLIAHGELSMQPFGRCNLWLSAKNISVEKTLPAVRRYADLGELESANGRLNASVNIYGSLSDKGLLKLRAQGNLWRGNMQLKNQPAVSIHNLNYLFQSNDLTNLQTYSCKIENAAITYQEFELIGDAMISNFAAPIYEAKANFSGDVKTLNIESIASGKIMGSANIKARNLSMTGVEKLDVLMDVSQLHAALLNENYIVDGEIFATKNSLLPRVSIKSGIVNGNFEGKVENYLPYLLDSKKPCEMKITGNLLANSLDLDRLFLMESDEKSMLNIRVAINAQAKEMQLFKEACLNSSAKVYYNNSTITINQLKTKMYGGSIAGDLKIFTSKIRSKRLNLDLYFSDIEIDKLIFLNEKFKLKSGSIQGLCDGAISLNSNFDSQGLDFQDAKGVVNFTIQNGRLYEFEPIQALSGYVKKALLQDVKFSALRNTISMESGTITIPRMEVRSSALSTYISGKQQIDGDFDYRLTLFVSELLLQKNRSIENPIRDDKTKLFLRFTSKNGQHEVSLDSEEWSHNFSKKMQREAVEIQAESKKLNKASAAEKDKMTLEWEGEALGEKKSDTPKKEEKKQPAEKKKSEVKIEWEE